ncbi:MAG: hypothetical protein ACYTBX_02575 [Planctomycetota bacterium]
MKPTIACAKIAGTSFWPAQAPITAPAAAETPADTVYWKIPAQIVKARKYILTR